jgi:type II secretory pathway pseudopilin PulG
MRRAFGMIQVILLMLILSTILTIMMKYATTTTKQTEDLFLQESAELFMQSAIEVALLGISAHDRSGGCINTLHIISDDNRFFADINITNYYLHHTIGCDHETLIQTEELHGMVEMDIVLTSNDAHPKNTRSLRITRRTMQRP